MRRHAIYPGTFDPVTNGHVDIVQRCRPLFDQVTVAVAINQSKTPLFTLDERMDMLRETFAGMDQVEVASFEGLLVEYARAKGARAIIRGLRAVSDFEFELQMALMNRRLAGEIETVFLMPSEEYTYLSSSIVKAVSRAGGDVAALVPAGVLKRLSEKAQR